MKAQVLRGIRQLEFLNRPISGPAAGEVIVRVEYCGICGTDVHCYATGLLVPSGTVLGHEITGVVSEAGEGSQPFGVGDRVAINPIPRCGACYWCERGQFVLCAEGLKNEIGLTRENDGGFAEYVRVKHPRGMLHRLPDGVSFQQGALVEPLATSLHAVRMSRLKPGDSTVVFGAGMIGLGVVEFLRLGGAGSIAVVEPSPQKRNLARQAGADQVFDPSAPSDDYVQEIVELTDGLGPDIIFECSGHPAAFQSSLSCVRKGGQVILVGFGEQAVSLNLLESILREVELKGILGYYDEFELVIGFLEKNRVHTDLLISDTLPLKELEKGLQQLLDTPDIVKVLVHP